MFKKNKIIEATPPAVNTAVLNGESPSAVARNRPPRLSPAVSALTETLSLREDVDIYGTVSGNIDAEESQIKIMTDGL